MKTQFLALLIGAVFCHFPAAQAEPTLPARVDGYERLAPLIGRWTQKGRESTCLENCRWHDGRFHVSETMSGTFRDDVLEFTSDSIDGGN